jgi:thymidylate synthase
VRIYQSFPEALNEIKRDLKEMGIQVHPKSVQDLDVSEDPGYNSFELQCYSYLVSSPRWQDIPLKNPEWAEAEFAERVSGCKLNPGAAWTLRQEYWERFLHNGRFSYTYAERMTAEIKSVMRLLKKDLTTRRAFLPVYSSMLDEQDCLTQRIPCSIGYWLYYRQGRLNIAYTQRSSDFFEHFNYDVCLADRLKCWFAEQLQVEPGTFCHFVMSLHCFAKDVESVF